MIKGQDILFNTYVVKLIIKKIKCKIIFQEKTNSFKLNDF